MENNHRRQSMLECSYILKEAFLILFKNTSLIFCSFITSVPLFCFLIFHEMILQTTLFTTSETLRQTAAKFNYNWQIPLHGSRKLIKDFSYRLIQFALLRLLPFHLLELCTAIVTVDLASQTYAKRKPLALKEVLHRSFKKARFEGILVTSTYVYFVSTCFQLASVWLVTNCYFILRIFVYNMFSVAVYRVSCAGLLSKYLEWTAVWNTSIVISILDGIHGADALALSAYFSRGSEGPGFLLMLVFFAWEVCLRLACFYNGCHKEGWKIVLPVGLMCIGNVLKWVVFVIYFYRRKELISGRLDEKAGEEDSAVPSVHRV